MEKLKKRILEQGEIVNASVLKVDNFLNHQIDPALMKEIGDEIAKHFADKKIDKVVTIEASGIAPALFTALALNVDVVFARKGRSLILNNDLYQTPVYSYTKEKEYSLTINKHMIKENENILFVDDFLANGQSMMAMHDLMNQANAKLVGAGVVIEKSFQAGRERAEEVGIEVYSLARIKKLYSNTIEFED